MMRHTCLFLALSLGAVCCFAEDATLSKGAIMKSDRALMSLKAGTVVEIVSRDDRAITIRHNGVTGTIPLTSAFVLLAPTPTPTPAAAVADSPASGPAKATPAVVLGPLTLFLVNSPADAADDLHEYIPDDENPVHWNHKVSIRHVRDLTDPQAYLAKLETEAASADPRVRFASLSESGENITELITYAPASFSLKFKQWSLMRASKEQGNGIAVYQYSVRYFNYGDATKAKIDLDRATMLRPFAVAQFQELAGVLKPHDVNLELVTDTTIKSFFPNGSYIYEPKIFFELSGYMPEGIEVPAFTEGSHVCALFGGNFVLFDSKGVAMPIAGGPISHNWGPFEKTPLRGKGVFRIRVEASYSYQFELRTGGVYTLVADCFLKDNQGKQFVVSAGREVTIVDTRAPDRSMDPEYRP